MAWIQLGKIFKEMQVMSWNLPFKQLIQRTVIKKSDILLDK